MPSEANIKKAKDMANQAGVIHVPELAMSFTPYEYAQLLDGNDKTAIEIRIKEVEQEIDRIERKQKPNDVEKMLQDPEVKRIWKLKDTENVSEGEE